MDLENKKQISDLLEETRQRIVAQGRVVDDRLLRREKNLESVLNRLESIRSCDVSLRYVRKGWPVNITPSLNREV
jgi:hypothetical protein